MKKVMLVVVFATLVLASITGCTPQAQETEEAQVPAGDVAATEEQKPGIALLVSAAGTLDDRSFNQACWQGVKDFAEEYGYDYAYYQPVEDTVEAQVTIADTAIKAGAGFIIINSDQFKAAASQMITEHPDVTFIIFDTVPIDEEGNQVLTDNILAIQFKEQEATFIAGYAAVVEGYHKLGFMGGQAVPAVVRFGYGFVAGAEAAAKDLGLDDVEMLYNYSGDFKPTPENQARAASWFQGGTEIIHVAAGPMGASVFAAAEQNGGVVIGVDSDQSAESETIITSAIKDLANVTYNALLSWHDGTFEGGKIVVYGAAEGGVGLPWDSSKFTNFTKEDYEDLLYRISNDVDGIASAIPTDVDYESPDQIPLEYIDLTYVE